MPKKLKIDSLLLIIVFSFRRLLLELISNFWKRDFNATFRNITSKNCPTLKKRYYFEEGGRCLTDLQLSGRLQRSVQSPPSRVH